MADQPSDRNTDQVVYNSIETGHVSGPVEYAALLPDDYSETEAPYPLLLLLHGAGGDKEYVCRLQPHIESMWRDGTFAKFITVTPSVRSGTIYLDDYEKKNAGKLS